MATGEAQAVDIFGKPLEITGKGHAELRAIALLVSV